MYVNILQPYSEAKPQQTLFWQLSEILSGIFFRT